jgi:hypothetical protein
MTDYRATPEQWAQCEVWGSYDEHPTACILELRARVEQLEANTKQWRTDHLRLANTCASLAPDRLEFFGALLPDDEDSQPTPNPVPIRSSLVERVSCAIAGRINPDQWLHQDAARAAIREVAAWLREHYGGPTASSTVLEQEAER